METTSTIGKVKFFIPKEGYGFVIENNSGKEYFFHITSTNEKMFNPDERVEFELEEGKRGLRAINVKKL